MDARLSLPERECLGARPKPRWRRGSRQARRAPPLLRQSARARGCRMPASSIVAPVYCKIGRFTGYFRQSRGGVVMDHEGQRREEELMSRRELLKRGAVIGAVITVPAFGTAHVGSAYGAPAAVEAVGRGSALSPAHSGEP